MAAAGLLTVTGTPAAHGGRHHRPGVATGRGEHRRSQQLGAEAVDLVPGEMLTLQARLHADCAEALLARGQRDEATALLGTGAHGALPAVVG